MEKENLDEMRRQLVNYVPEEERNQKIKEAELIAMNEGKVIIPKRGNRNKWFNDIRRDPTTGKKVVFEKMTAQQDLFCQFVAEGFTRTESYRRAYPDSTAPHINGPLLAKQEKIQKRILFMQKERAALAMQVSPIESLSRWNFLYFNCLQAGDIKGAMEAQKNIDKINGSQDAFSEAKKDNSSLRGDESEWQKTARSLMDVISNQPPPEKSTIPPVIQEVIPIEPVSAEVLAQTDTSSQGGISKNVSSPNQLEIDPELLLIVNSIKES